VSSLARLGEAPSIHTPVSHEGRVPIGAGHVQTVTGVRDPLTRNPVAQGEAGVGALSARVRRPVAPQHC
jgi:hypothetical protein